jgi:rhodanese-related sulfurtransferase
MAGRDPKTRRTISFIALTLVVLGVLVVTQYQSAPPSVSAAEAYRMARTDSAAIFLDVRSVEEYRGREGHLPGALLVPLPELERRLPELARHRDVTFIAYCEHGQRSLNATALLRRNGFTAFNLEGGILKWAEAKYPVERAEEEL